MLKQEGMGQKKLKLEPEAPKSMFDYIHISPNQRTRIIQSIRDKRKGRNPEPLTELEEAFFRENREMLSHIEEKEKDEEARQSLN